MFFSRPLSSVTLFICLVTFASGATLVPSEVEALKQIAKTLGKTNWNFSVDPCSGQSGWVRNGQVKGAENALSKSFRDAHSLSLSISSNSTSTATPLRFVSIFKRQRFIFFFHPSVNMFFSRPLSSVTLFICLVTFASGATLVPSEVEALKQIAKTLGKTNWNFSVDPCSGQSDWVRNGQVKGAENAVTCNCSFPNDTCHVTSIVLKSQNLPGTCPPELVKLQYLHEIDLTRNYLNGTIPPEWGSMKLVNISLLGNRLTGSIPKELGNISTLVNVTLEFNQLSGVIPPELGNLSRLEKLHLTSNNIFGELPGTLAKLTALKDFRIGQNHFTGKIPSFIENWTNLEKLVIQASGLDGPFPSSIALLTKMTDMRISDLSGTESSFPPVRNMRGLKTLILRSCNIVGQLPPYLGNLTNLKVLDLSFNKLSGQIPNDFEGLLNTQYLYLTGNLLSGPVPDWMVKGGKYYDLSFNQFTDRNTALSCQRGSVNLYGNSPSLNATGTVSCLGSSKCPRNLSYLLRINCGGRAVPDGRNTYQDDTNLGGPSFLYQGSNWGFSSTGHFLDDDRTGDPYISRNISSLSANTSELYMDARLSPLSLTYYAFCLLNGNYSVDLHFAEIVFTDDRTYSSLGRRIFDIYIQVLVSHFMGKVINGKNFKRKDNAIHINSKYKENQMG
ncbi:unnamed protein product [Ilex paraguariensis]|uniref:non-specific serine/threonine protein kinase n=1 Tax=Ilex paraguariensis TaxID=185542 RepID=A0ABC8S3E7_9AQUA